MCAQCAWKFGNFATWRVRGVGRRPSFGRMSCFCENGSTLAHRANKREAQSEGGRWWTKVDFGMRISRRSIETFLRFYYYFHCCYCLRRTYFHSLRHPFLKRPLYCSRSLLIQINGWRDFCTLFSDACFVLDNMQLCNRRTSRRIFPLTSFSRCTSNFIVRVFENPCPS